MSKYDKKLAEAYVSLNKKEQERKPEILPCPFCGGEPCLTGHIAYEYGRTYGFYCSNCGAMSGQFFTNAKDAFDAWNRRTNYGLRVGTQYKIIGVRAVSDDEKDEDMD